MTAPPEHHSQVFGSPWAGVHGTLIASGRHYGRHWHGTYGLGLLEDGAQTSASGRGRVDAYAGDLIATNPGEVHDGRPLGSTARRWRMVYLEPPVLASLAREAGIGNADGLEIVRPVIQDPLLAQHLRQLLDRLAAWSPAADGISELGFEESLIRTTALLLEQHTGAVARVEPDGEVQRARERLADDPLTPPTLAELAATAGLSRFQLLRRFEKAYGLPPYLWLLQRRADLARGLIRDGLSLAQAAVAAGFADQSHLTRIFVRLYGYTPGAWQKAAARPRS